MKRSKKAVIGIVAWLVAIVYFYPILVMFLNGFKTEQQAVHMPPSLVFHPTLHNYQLVFSSGVFSYLGNSLIAAIGSTIIALAIGVPAAYALAIYKPKHGDDIFFWFITTKILPSVGVIVPVYIMFRDLNMLDTLYGLSLLYIGMNTPIVVWMMRSFFTDIPYSVIESSQVDGAHGFALIWRIILPLVRPGLFATSLLCLVFSWNEFFFALNITDTHAATLPILVSSFMTSEGLFWSKLSAIGTIAVLPPVIFGWIAQKQLVRGLSMGAVKG
ncbi:carbohydrate ABC transporter permease [Alicyclobacillus sp. SO9]|uniref:carbohydrate ABC transporter permease n=1 Tax=Alicyclobacillus sp. SO9 TaxID=2665646 RepID=UPI0018E78863|nr:carbohydrate ABC transporter permease [Alicyclobacillus sp. SO9]QQE77902.1 carbohydrate ABC transporter permease [Alicyclobacillus sp. SO9]